MTVLRQPGRFVGAQPWLALLDGRFTGTDGMVVEGAVAAIAGARSDSDLETGAGDSLIDKTARVS